MGKTRTFSSIALTFMLLTGCGVPESDAPARDEMAAQTETVQTEVSAPVATETKTEAVPAAVTTPPKTATRPAPKAKPATETKVESPPQPKMLVLTVPLGTDLRVKLDQELSTRSSKVGDAFSASVVAPLMSGEQIAVPAGSKVRGMVTAVQESEGGNPAVLKVDFTHVDVQGVAFPLKATIVEANPEKKATTSTGEAAAKIGTGAAAGAILGRVIGKDTKGTLIGAAVGAAAGTAIVLSTKDTYGVLAKDSEMGLRLEEPLRVEIMEKPTT